MRKNLVIIGARGFGREVYNAFDRIYQGDDEWSVKGFLDSQPEVLDGYIGYPPIIGSPESYEIQPNDYFFCAMGDVKWRKYYAEKLIAKGADFVSIVSSNSFIGKNSKYGVGCYIDSNVHISCDINIGNFTYIFGNSIIGHDVQLGNYCHLGAFSFMGGFSKMDDLATLHPGARVLPHKIIGAQSIVGAGSVVIRSVPPDTTVIGVPAKK